jgi:hypothetical protein
MMDSHTLSGIQSLGFLRTELMSKAPPPLRNTSTSMGCTVRVCVYVCVCVPDSELVKKWVSLCDSHTHKHTHPRKHTQTRKHTHTHLNLAGGAQDLVREHEGENDLVALKQASLDV